MGFKLLGALQAAQLFQGKELENLAKDVKTTRGIDLYASAEKAGHSLDADKKGGALYFRAKMLGYDLPNGNGDAIERIFAAAFGPSFIGRHLDVNHKTDIENIVGKILSTFHVESALSPINAGEERIVGRNTLFDDETDPGMELQLEGVCRIDMNTDLGLLTAEKLNAGTITGVSQEANTDYAECSVCGHRLENVFSRPCEHITAGAMMVKAFQVQGKKHRVLAYKKHANPVGSGLAVVTVPAYDKGRVQEIVNAALKGKMPLEAALREMKEQEIVYGGSEILEEAFHMLKGNKSVAVLESALLKLNGLETLAIMNSFKAGVEEHTTSLLDKGKEKAEDAAKKAGEAKEEVKNNPAEASETAKTAAAKAEHAKDNLEDAAKMAEHLSATFKRQPNIQASYWLLSDKTGKVLGRVTIGALSGGKLDRKVKVNGESVDLKQYLASESWATELTATEKKVGHEKLLAQDAEDLGGQGLLGPVPHGEC